MTKRNKGFTLTEIIVVIVLIVFLVALAVPALNWMTGSNSVEAAANLISASLARSRNDAIFGDTVMSSDPNNDGRNRTGVLTYYDSREGRYALIVVNGAETGTSPFCIDIATKVVDVGEVPMADPIYLPKGIGVQVMSGLGTENYLPQGAFMFRHSSGIFDTTVYGIDVASGLAQIGVASVPVASGISPHIGFVLYDHEELKAHVDRGGNEEQWLDQYATPFAVNRLNGTLIRGE